MFKVKIPFKRFFMKPEKPKDIIQKILDDYEFKPDFIPRTKQLFSKKSKRYYVKNIKPLSYCG